MAIKEGDLVEEKKRFIFSLSILLLAFIFLLMLILAAQYSDYRTKEFPEILDIKEEEITKIMISSPMKIGEYKTTVKQADIDMLIDYFNQFEYKRLNGDQSAYMPMKASIIYIFKEEYADFIIPYGQEAMISYKVYQIKNGPVEQQFLIHFYNSIKEDE